MSIGRSARSSKRRQNVLKGRSLDDVERAFVQDSLKRHLRRRARAGNDAYRITNWAFNHPRLGSRVLCLSARRIAGDAESSSLILVAIEDATDARRSTDTLREGSRRKDEFSRCSRTNCAIRWLPSRMQRIS